MSIGPSSQVVRRRLTTRPCTLFSSNFKLPCNLHGTLERFSVMPSTVNGTELSAQEFRDAFLLRYGRSPRPTEKRLSQRLAQSFANGRLSICSTSSSDYLPSDSLIVDQRTCRATRSTIHRVEVKSRTKKMPRRNAKTQEVSLNIRNAIHFC
jgi:hypothetical protein